MQRKNVNWKMCFLVIIVEAVLFLRTYFSELFTEMHLVTNLDKNSCSI